MALDLPNNPKLVDVVGALAELDQQVAHNDARIAALEGAQRAGEIEGQRQIEQLKSQLERERWAARYRRAR